MLCVIATKPGRRTRRSFNAVQKYAKVRTQREWTPKRGRILPPGTFKFVTSLAHATVFESTAAALNALQTRARLLEQGPTNDLTIAEVAQGYAPPPPPPPAGLRVVQFLNG